MKSFLFLLLIIAFMALGCTRAVDPTSVQPCTPSVPINREYAKASALQTIMNRYTATGLPGVSVAVYTPTDGYWTGTAGYARIEDKTVLQPCHLQYSQSVAKTYMAVAMLKLAQTNRLDLDAPITHYLPAIDQFVRGAQAITVRMLLNHTSGVFDYAVAPSYVAFLIQHPFQPLTTDDLLAYVRGKPLAFTPGSRYDYSNTNYLLLALVADQITGDHAQFIRDTILKPANLTQTFYHDNADYLHRPDVVNSYFDRFGNGQLENVTRWQQTNVANMFGDDGMVASPLDYIRFLRSLFEGQQLTAPFLKTMTTWVNGDDGKPTYGMGLFQQAYNGQIGYGHSGAGLGAGCALYYFPQKQVYVFIAVNVGLLTDGPVTRAVGDMQDQLLDELLK